MGNAIQKIRKSEKEFTCQAPDAKSVCLGGTFNDWSETSTPLKKSRNGSWSATLSLLPGRYEYKFIVDGKWCCSPDCKDEPSHGCPDCVPNAFGTMNRVIEIE